VIDMTHPASVSEGFKSALGSGKAADDRMKKQLEQEEREKEIKNEVEKAQKKAK
jgi:hypothetical protein